MSDQASQYRAALYIFSFAGFLCFWAAWKGSQGLFPPALGLSIGLLGVGCLFVGAWFGMKGARVKLEERQKKADAIALITLAAFLKDKSEEELEKAIAKGGPAGEAAALVLERRRNGLSRASKPIAVPPEAT
jgi:hypothetical protein